MKITIVGTAWPFRGGLAAFNERLAREFMNEGNDVDILTFTLQYPGFLFPGRSQFIESPSPDGLKIERCISSVNPLNWFRIGNRLKRSRPDLILFKYWLPFMAPCFGTIARIAASNRHSRVICIFDNVLPHERRPGDKILTRYFVSAVHGAVAMSQSVLDDLKIFRESIQVKLNPHPLFDNFGSVVPRSEALSRLGLDDSYRWILFFGFIRRYKGLDLLLDAFSESRLRGRKLRLLIAGEFYEDDAPYRHLVKRHNLEKEVHFFDRFINDDEVSLFFSAADLVVQPYRDATQSGVTQIAYHFNKPMIVTDVGGLREIVPDGVCGFVVKPAPAAIADAIVRIYSENNLGRFGLNIMREKEKYTWSKMTSAITGIYTKIQPDDN